MTEPVPLILASTAISAFSARPRVSPGAAVVYATADGLVIEEGKPLTWKDRASARQRFEVDVSDHQSTFAYQLPCHGDIFYFESIVDVSWRVTRPWEVVRRRIVDGSLLLSSRLLDELPRLTRRFDPEDVALAEEAINDRFGNRTVHLYEGLSLHRCFARLRIDPKKLEQAVALAEQMHANVLSDNRMKAIRAAVDGDPSFVMLHLAQNPDDTATVVNLIAENRKVDLDTRRALVQRMVEEGLLQDVDLEEFRQRLLSQVVDLTSPGQPGPTVGQVAALPRGLQDGVLATDRGESGSGG